MQNRIKKNRKKYLLVIINFLSIKWLNLLRKHYKSKNSPVRSHKVLIWDYLYPYVCGLVFIKFSYKINWNWWWVRKKSILRLRFYTGKLCIRNAGFRALARKFNKSLSYDQIDNKKTPRICTILFFPNNSIFSYQKHAKVKCDETRNHDNIFLFFPIKSHFKLNITWRIFYHCYNFFWIKQIRLYNNNTNAFIDNNLI